MSKERTKAFLISLGLLIIGSGGLALGYYNVSRNSENSQPKTEIHEPNPQKSNNKKSSKPVNKKKSTEIKGGPRTTVKDIKQSTKKPKVKITKKIHYKTVTTYPKKSTTNTKNQEIANKQTTSSNSSSTIKKSKTPKSQQSTAKSTPKTGQQKSTVSVQPTKTVISPSTVSGFNFLGHHFPIANFSGSGFTPANDYVYKWTGMKNYYLIERTGIAGRYINKLRKGNRVIVNGRVHHVKKILHGVPNTSYGFEIAYKNVKKYGMGIQSCEASYYGGKARLTIWLLN